MHIYFSMTLAARHNTKDQRSGHSVSFISKYTDPVPGHQAGHDILPQAHPGSPALSQGWEEGLLLSGEAQVTSCDGERGQVSGSVPVNVAGSVLRDCV
jgi:hypothetical protein